MRGPQRSRDQKPRYFRAQKKVRFGDIDQAGIVYYPRFVHYFHVAMEDFFGEVLDIDYAAFLNEHRLGLPTVRLEIDFKRPLRYGDQIEVEVAVESIGETSVVWNDRVYRRDDPELVATARLVTVNIDLDSYEKRPLPDWLRQPLERYRQEGI